MQSQLSILVISKLASRGDMPFWRVDPFQGNNQLFDSRLTIKRGAPGYWHLHANVGQDFSSHFLAVSRTFEKHKTTGIKRLVWVQDQEDDHYVDTARLQEAAAFHYGFGVRRTPPQPKPKQESRPGRHAPSGGPGGW
jgi:hypothetical protein